MRQGDKVFFFTDRNIYGVGELANLSTGLISDCKFLNFPEANIPSSFPYQQYNGHLLWDQGPESINQRWLCTFEPSPLFFKVGVDMDYVLSSNPSKFKMLRTFQGLSFIKIDDEECQALVDILLRANRAYLGSSGAGVFVDNHTAVHSNICGKLNPSYQLNPNEIMKQCQEATTLKHEMALEAGLVYQLTQGDVDTMRVFGKWDYLPTR